MEILKKKLNDKYIRLNLVFMCFSFGALSYTMITGHSHFRECMSISMLSNMLMLLSNAFYHKDGNKQRDCTVCLISSFIVLCMTILAFLVLCVVIFVYLY